MKFYLTCLAIFASIQLCQSQEPKPRSGNPITSDSALLFKMAQLMTVLGDYQSAALYHKKITEYYPTKEAWTNAGTMSVLAAMDLLEAKKMPYILPLELDAKTRLKGGVFHLPERDSLRQAYLEDAIVQFDKALAIDENLVNVYRNKGCALALVGKYDEANSCLDKGISHCSTQKMTPDFLVSKGIVCALQGDKAKGIQWAKQALSIGSYLAAQNLAILEGKVAPEQTLLGPAPISGVEQVEWYPLNEFLANPAVEHEIWIKDSIRCGMHERQGSNVYLHFEENTKKYALIQETKPKYVGATLRAIILESSADNIQEAYGVPVRDMELPDGRAWVYPDANIFFLFNHRRVLQSWGVYLTAGN